jgi:hypothetical protein
MSRIRAHLSFANVLAGTALFVALGGGAYAATGGFVGSKGSIHGCVAGKGALTVVKAGKSCPRKTTSLVFDQTGPRGNPGATGPKGAAGSNGRNGTNGTNGTDGTNGAPGAAAGFAATSTSTRLTYVFTGLSWLPIPTVVASISLPAGSFVVQADVQVADTADAAALGVTCFTSGPDGEGTISVGNAAGAVEQGSIGIGGTLTQSTAGTLNVLCTGPPQGSQPDITGDGTITATQVSSATSTG